MAGEALRVKNSIMEQRWRIQKEMEKAEKEGRIGGRWKRQAERHMAHKPYGHYTETVNRAEPERDTGWE